MSEITHEGDTMNALTTASARPTFSLAPRSLDEAMRFADMIASTDLAPKDYRGKPGNILVAIQMGSELGLNPMQALQSISVINGRPAVWGDGALALVRSHPACEGINEGVDGEGDKRHGWCEVKRRGQPPQRRTFSIADAKRAGLLGKPGPWQQYQDRMLQMRARGFAIRDVFPDALRGVITVEEARDYPTTVDAPVEATFAAQGLQDAREAMIAEGKAFRVVFHDGQERVYGDKGTCWAAIGRAAEACDTLACIEVLAENNAGLLETRPGEEVPAGLADLLDLLALRREALNRSIDADPEPPPHDPDTGEVFDAEAFAKQKAREIAAAQDEAELQAAMTGDGWAHLPEKWAAELRQRAKIRRGQFAAAA